jgi:HD-GYP domain-containing protein (c-di-GMP phosphodiesterase class II)
MSDQARRIAAAEELVRRLSASLKAVQLYSPEHPIVGRATDLLTDHFDLALAETADVVVGVIDRQIVVDGIPLPHGPGAAETAERLSAVGIERILVERGVTRDEVVTFLRRLAALRPTREADAQDAVQALGSAHIRVGRLRMQHREEWSADGSVANFRAAHQNAVAGAERLWEQACAEGGPDPNAAKAIVEGLASAVAQNRRAMMAMTAMYRYDNYTFTHMVNVSVLTMAQARSLGIEGAQLCQFGLAGLMHDIGKIKTPTEILAKPDRLTPEEFVIMKRHPADGGELLRRQLELPPLAAIVAFEHHLRVDGAGYPSGVNRPSLNLATQLCSIADVYDAMRSQRHYQQAFPTDRIVAVLTQHDTGRFDQQLVRRFSQLMGIYPLGNVVKLDTGALAVVVQIHAAEPSRPLVRVVVAPDGSRLPTPVDLALWVDDSPTGPPPRIVCPVDPNDAGIDPLAFLDSSAA